MKKFLLGSALLAAAIAGPAMAADMPVKVKAAPPVVVYDWSGVYMGFGVGYNWQNFDWAFNPPLPINPNQSFSIDTDSWIVDGHGGMQAQFGQFVIGAEASYSVTSNRWAGQLCPNLTLSCQARVLELFTGGGRIGWSPISYDTLLVYAAGGYAAGLAETRVVRISTGLEPLDEHTNAWHHGWYAGGGFDWMVHKGALVDVILGFEYRHVELDTKFHCEPATCNLVNAVNRDLDPTMDIVRARLTIKTKGWGIFLDPAPKVVAKY